MPGIDYSTSDGPWVHIETFGFQHGVPQTVIGCLLVDLRGVALDDPAATAERVGRDGKDADVVQHVMASRTAFTRIEQVVGQASALLDFNASTNLITSVGPAATQTVHHLHVHLVPRASGDGLPLPWTPQQAAARSAAALG